ncbi:MAG TPA: ABC transporter permease [Methanomassiliicoccales archaeon]|jgi:ABC-2 type transport system permease protein
MTTRNDIPSDLEQVLISTRYEVEKHLQSRAFVGIIALVMAVLALMTVAMPALGLSFSSNAVDFVQNYTTWIEIIVLIAAVAFASGALSSEFERRTGLLMFPQPVKRTTYLMGKYLSSIIMTGVALGIYYVLVSLMSLAIVGSIPGAILISFGLAMLYGAAVCAVAFLFSALLKTNTAAIVATVLTFLMVMTIVSQLLSMSGVDPFFLASNASGTISFSLQDPYPVTHTTLMGDMSSTTFVPSETGAAMVLIGYIVVSLLVSTVLFRRKQF